MFGCPATQQLVNACIFFADSVAISLTGKCGGLVQISVNDTMYGVCASDWTKENADVVCAELNCGKVSHQTTTQ